MKVASSYFYFKARFKLPRNNYYFCSRNNVGNLTTAGLPNITNGHDLPYVQTGNSATDPTGVGNGLYIRAATKDGISTSGSVSYRASFAFDASRSSSIYGNSITVQPLSVNCYLEFYIN